MRCTLTDMAGRFTLDAARDALRRQDGVVARRQLLDVGAGDHDVERMLRRRELVVVHPGVYVAHTGPLEPSQRAWAAVLACWPAALSHGSALPEDVRRGVAATADGAVHVVVRRDRQPRPLSGVRVHRVAALDQRVLWNRSPPRVRLEHAAVDVASQMLRHDHVAAAYDLLARTCHTRLTTPHRIHEVLTQRHRVACRPLLGQMLSDLGDGACSVLEQGYLERVERAHGLPTARRQRRRRLGGTSTYIDAEYEQYGLIVELDGMAFHDGPRARDHDAARDLANLAGGEQTARITYGLVFDTPCRTAAHIARLLQRRGWAGKPQTCPECRPATQTASSRPPA